MGEDPTDYRPTPDEQDVSCARDDAETLAKTSMITERRAFAYALRDLHEIGRQDAAEVMETSATNVDTLLQNARKDIDGAHEVVEYLKEHEENED